MEIFASERSFIEAGTISFLKYIMHVMFFLVLEAFFTLNFDI